VAANCPLGPQPARQHLYDQRWPVARAARELGVSHTHLVNCLLGRCSPSPEVRDKLPAMLGLPLSELFTEESIAREYAGPRGSYRLMRNGAGQ
jgi:hypothetical protein